MRIKEASARQLLDAMQATMIHWCQNPALRVVILKVPGDDIEITLLYLMRIKEALFIDMLNCKNPLAFQYSPFTIVK
jgi:hypothetical protein